MRPSRRVDQEGKAPMKRWLLIAGGAFGLVALLAGGRWWQEQQRVTAAKVELQKILAKDGAYMESVLGTEQNESRLSYKEFFDLCDKAIEGKRTLMVDLRGAGVGLEPALVESARAFLEAGNVLIRAKRQIYQEQFELDVAEKSENSKIRQLRALHVPNVIDREETIGKMQALVVLSRFIVEQLENATQDFAESYRRYAALEQTAIQEWQQRGLNFKGAAEQYQALNMKVVKAVQAKGAALRTELNNTSAVLVDAAAQPVSR